MTTADNGTIFLAGEGCYSVSNLGWTAGTGHTGNTNQYLSNNIFQELIIKASIAGSKVETLLAAYNNQFNFTRISLCLACCLILSARVIPVTSQWPPDTGANIKL